MENDTGNQPPQSQPNQSQSGVMDVRSAAPRPPTSPSQANTAPPSPKETKPELKPHKSRAPKIVIAVALIIALGLAAVATVVYLQSREETEPMQESDTSRQETVQPATTEDVDETTRSVDEALSETDTTQDFPEEDLSDQALGL